MGGEKKVMQAAIATLQSAFPLRIIDVYSDKHTFMKDFYSIWAVISSIPRLLNYPKPYIVYSSYNIAACIAVFLSIMRRDISVVYHYHGIKAFPHSAKYRNPAKLVLSHVITYVCNRLQQISEWIVFNNADVVLVPSARTATRLRKMRGNNQTIQIPSFVDPDIFRFKKKIFHSNLQVGFLGRIAYEKGIIELTTACVAGNSHVDTLYVTHQSGLNEYILKEVRNIVKGKLKFVLHRDPTIPTIVNMLQTIDCTVLPSYSEEFPLALLESLSTGTICFVTDVGECKNVISAVDRQLILRSSDSNSISEKLLWYTSLSKKAKAVLQRKARQVALTYSPRVFNQRILRVFGELCK